MDGWKMCFLLGRTIFRCYVSFREGKFIFQPIHFQGLQYLSFRDGSLSRYFYLLREVFLYIHPVTQESIIATKLPCQQQNSSFGRNLSVLSISLGIITLTPVGFSISIHGYWAIFFYGSFHLKSIDEVDRRNLRPLPSSPIMSFSRSLEKKGPKKNSRFAAS